MSATRHRKRDSRGRAPRRRPTQTLVLLDYPDENELVGKPIAVVGPPRLTERRGVRAIAIAAGVVVAMGSIIGGSVAIESNGVDARTLRATAPDPLIVPKMPSRSPERVILASTGPDRQAGRTSRARPSPSASPAVVSQPPDSQPSNSSQPRLSASPAVVSQPPAPQPSPTIPAWSAPGVPYTRGELVSYEGLTYECLQSHTSEIGWDPVDAQDLWQLVS